MGANERNDPIAGPFVNLSQAYCNGLDFVAKGYEPVLKGIGRCNLELMGLMTRRTRAWFELSARVSQCKTPQDLAREQLQFWQAAAHDYVDGSRRLASAFGALALPGQKAVEKTAAAVRDYIDFPDSKAAVEEAPARERRAA